MRIEKVKPEIIEEQKDNHANILKNENQMIHRVIYVMSEICINPSTQKYHTVFDSTHLRLYFHNRPEIYSVCMSVLKDQSTKSFLTAHTHWKTRGKVLYRISDDFFDVFKNVSLDSIQADALPKNMCGYCILPKPVKDRDGDEIEGFYFFSGKGHDFLGLEESSDWRSQMNGLSANEGDNILALAWEYKGGDYFGYSTTAYSGHETLQEMFKNVVYSERTLNQGVKSIKEEIHEDGFSNAIHLRVFCNLLIYLESGNPDLRMFRNTITYQSPTSQTPVKKDKSLSQSDIILVGFGYKKNPLYSKEFYVQPAYWAHRHVGQGRTEKKYMLIKGSLKKRSQELLSQEVEI